MYVLISLRKENILSFLSFNFCFNSRPRPAHIDVKNEFAEVDSWLFVFLGTEKALVSESPDVNSDKL